jgi:hypothetical protein
MESPIVASTFNFMHVYHSFRGTIKARECLRAILLHAGNLMEAQSFSRHTRDLCPGSSPSGHVFIARVVPRGAVIVDAVRGREE